MDFNISSLKADELSANTASIFVSAIVVLVTVFLVIITAFPRFVTVPQDHPRLLSYSHTTSVCAAPLEDACCDDSFSLELLRCFHLIIVYVFPDNFWR